MEVFDVSYFCKESEMLIGSTGHLQAPLMIQLCEIFLFLSGRTYTTRCDGGGTKIEKQLKRNFQVQLRGGTGLSIRHEVGQTV